MANMTVTSVQQYSVDRLRFSFNTEYDVERLSSIDIQIKDSNNEDVSDRFKTIKESMSDIWEYESEAETFDLYLKTNTSLEAGSYHVYMVEPKNLYGDEKVIYDGFITINYMEDIRVTIDSITFEGLNTLIIQFKSIYEEPVYQSKKLMENLDFNIIDAIGTNYNTSFQAYSIAMHNTDDTVKEIRLALTENGVLPSGTSYFIRFTSIFKSRTESLISGGPYKIHYMTNTPPSLGSANIYVNAKGIKKLAIQFSEYPEKGIYDNSSYKIVSPNGKDVTSVFETETELTNRTVAGVTYITKMEVNFLEKEYTLEKGIYTVEWNWNNPYIENSTVDFKSDWLLHAADNVSLNHIESIAAKFNTPIYNSFLSRMDFDIELDGSVISKAGAGALVYDAFSTIQESNPSFSTMVQDGSTNEIIIGIKDPDKLKHGTYSFLFYQILQIEENGKVSEIKDYQYIAQMDIIGEVTPHIKEILPTNIDEFTILLENPIPIIMLEKAIPHLVDSYNGTALSDYLMSVEESNVWPTGEKSVSELNLRMTSYGTIPSGRYTFNFEFLGKILDRHPVDLQYMETRRGYIESLVQTDLSHVKITFSQAQSRKFLLSCKLHVVSALEGDTRDYTERFELLENVLKDDQYAINELIFPMDHEDDLPRGSYIFKFIYSTDNSHTYTVYEYWVDLDYMTTNVPSIQSAVSSNLDELACMKVCFKGYIESVLYEKADITITNESGKIVANLFKDRANWKIDYAERSSIIFAKNIYIPIKSEDTTLNRGSYNVTFSWENSYPYLEDVTATIYMDFALPSVKTAEVTSLSRLYFQFDQRYQNSWLSSLHVDIYDQNGINHNDYFKTIQDSNTFESGLSSDDINLDLQDGVISNLSFGIYQFVFYHIDVDGEKQAEYIARLNIKAALTPSIANNGIEQTASNRFRITLKDAMPVQILEGFKIKVESFGKHDVSDYFQSITASNNWDSNVIEGGYDDDKRIRTVAYFDLLLKQGTKIDINDTYTFIMYCGDYEMDSINTQIEYAEGITCEISTFTQTSLSEIELTFREEQAVHAFSHMYLKVISETGTDCSDRFCSLDDVIAPMRTNNIEYFRSIKLKLASGKVLKTGKYWIIINYSSSIAEEYEEKEETELRQIYFMTTQSPTIQDVAITKDSFDQKSLLVTFSPLLEFDTLYQNAEVTMFLQSNEDIRLIGNPVTDDPNPDKHDKFVPKEKWEVKTTTVDDITYVESITIPFDTTQILNRDTYVMRFSWLEVENLGYLYGLRVEKVSALDYILYPIKKIEIIDMSTIEMTFVSPISQSWLKDSELLVELHYVGKNEYGVVIQTEDVTKWFESVTASNDFSDPVDADGNTIKNAPDKQWNSIKINIQPGTEIPSGTYVFYLAHKTEVPGETEVTQLRMAYSGTLYISYLQAPGVNDVVESITQGGIDFLYVNMKEYQNIVMISDLSLKVTHQNGNDYSGYFKSIYDSNEFESTDEYGATYTDHFRDKIKRGIKETVVDENGKVVVSNTGEILSNISDLTGKIHTTIEVVKVFRLSLGQGKAIPAGKYSIELKSGSNVYFSGSVDTTWMTTEPPEIYSMEINGSYLSIDFLPYGENVSMMASNFLLMTNKGIDGNGDIIGEDKTSSFGSIVNGTMKTLDQNGITYISNIQLPIKEGTSLAAGLYTLKWIWNKESFLPDISYTGSLDVISQGIKSVSLTSSDTITVVMISKKKGEYLKKLQISAINSAGEDVTDLFMEMKDSNADIEDSQEVDTFFIKVSDDTDVITDTYTFTIVEEEMQTTGNTSGDSALIPIFVFSINIVFMTKDFPNLTLVDNLSSEEYSVVALTKLNVSDYYGRFIQLLSDSNNDRVLLEESNQNTYIGSKVKIFNPAKLDELWFSFDGEVHPCLLNAVDFKIVNDDGQSVSEKFKTFAESNVFSSRKVLDYVDFLLEKGVRVDELTPDATTGNEQAIDEGEGGSDEQSGEASAPSSINTTIVEKNYIYKVTATHANGEDMTQDFLSIGKSNDFPEPEKDGEVIETTSFCLKVKDGTIEEYDIDQITFTMTRTDVSNPNLVENMKIRTRCHTKEIQTVTKAKLILESDETIIPGEYDIQMTYVNELGSPGAVVIPAFNYSGNLPFISNAYGKIESIEPIDMYTLKVTLSDDIPTKIFDSIELVILDEDGVDQSDRFEKVNETNDFSAYNKISELPDPYSFKVTLQSGKTLPSGVYTFQFSIDTTAKEESSDFAFNTMVIWEKANSLPYMIRTQAIQIKSITRYGIDSIRIDFTNPLDSEMMRNFIIGVENQDKVSQGETDVSGNPVYYYDADIFEPVENTNNFGMHLLLSESKYLNYSSDGSSWTELDTQVTQIMNDAIYSERLDKYFVACGNGVILTKDDIRTSDKFTSIVIPSKKSLNAIVDKFNMIIAIGNDGTIVKSSDGVEWQEINSPVKTTLTRLLYVEKTKTLVAIGYKGTILTTTDGLTWTKCNTITESVNLNGIAYWENYVDENGETQEVRNPGYYIVGNNGVILYSSDLIKFDKLVSNINHSLFGITCHNDKIVTVGDTGIILTSEDGITWTSEESPVTYTLRNVIYGDTSYIICGANGQWLTSKSGSVWTLNSSFIKGSFRNIVYIPSQYENNRKANFLYVKLKKGESLGSINIYSGSGLPSKDNFPENMWTTETLQKAHVGDLYYPIEYIDGKEVKTTVYQYWYSDQSKDYEWIERKETTVVPSSGNFHFYILTETNDEYDILCESSDNALTYMTSEPGTMIGATLCSPDIPIDDRIIESPYLKIDFEKGDPLAIYYSGFEVYSNADEITGNFTSLREGFIVYGSDMTAESLIVPIKMEKIKSFKYDMDGTIQWIWSPSNRNDDNTATCKLKSICSVVKSISLVKGSMSQIEIQFTDETMPLDYIYDSERSSSLLNFIMLEIPKDNVLYADEEVGNDYFKDITETNAFNDPTVVKDGYVQKLILEIAENKSIPKGNYMIQIKSTRNGTLDTDDQIRYTTYKWEVTQVLSAAVPEIRSVSSMNYINEVERIVEGTSTTYEKTTDPSMEDPITENWFISGDETLAYHVGDKWTNTTTGVTWVFIRDVSFPEEYRWVQEEESAHLQVTFNPYPTIDAIRYMVDSFTLYDISSTEKIWLNNFFERDVDEWDIVTTGTSNEYVSAIYIPFKPGIAFPGTTKGHFSLYWADGCPYPTLNYPTDDETSLVMNGRGINYGQIRSVGTFHETYLDSENVEQNECGIEISFTTRISTTFLKTLEWSFSHTAYDEQRNGYDEDVSQFFKGISESNSDWDETGVTSTQTMRIALADAEEIEADYYNLEMIGERDPNDLVYNENNAMVVYSSKRVSIPWITTDPPKDISVKFGNVSGYNNPVLSITFKNGGLPDYSTCTQYKLSVVKQDTGKQFGLDNGVFCKWNEKELTDKKGWSPVYEDEGSTKIKTVRIPMKDAQYLPAGTYDVKFSFNPSSQLHSLPITGFASFKVSSGGAMTPIGKVTATSWISPTEVYIDITLDPSVNKKALLAKSSIGKSIGVSNYKELFKKLDLVFKKGSTNYADFFKASGKIEKTPKGLRYRVSLKNNKKINPGTVKCSFKLSDCVAILEGKCEFKGLILNKIGKATNDKVCYIVKETRGGVTRRRVYKKYKSAKGRINKLKRLNKATEKQYKRCKKCRKIKLLTTTKIKSQIEKLLIREGKISNGVYSVAVCYYYDIMAPKLNCNDIDFISEDSYTDGYERMSCEGYVEKNLQYSWVFKIATMATKFPTAGKKRIWFTYIIRDGVQLDRGFKADKNKKTSKCKKEIKRLGKWIKSYKKKVSKCKKCKKRTIAKKSSNSIGWGTALFPDAIRTSKASSKSAKYFTSAFSKPKMGCSKASFKFVKKNKKFCRLTCEKINKSDKTLDYGAYKATFIK